MRIISIVMVSVFLCLLANCEQHSKEPYSPEQQYLFSMFENRRSVRGYKSDPIPDEQIEKIIPKFNSNCFNIIYPNLLYW